VLSPEIGRFAFRWAIFIVLVAVGLLATLRPGTPEFAVTLLTLLSGMLFLVVIVVCIRVIGR
jgi:nitrogen fixation/metabolism regulation signal transduction histidine kinase